jgi:hypothetical protein
LPESTLDAYLAVMAADNLTANGQPQTCAACHTFGSKKRCKDVWQIVGRNPWTGVCDFYLDMAFLAQRAGRLEACAQDDPAGWANRLEGIHTQIEEDLLQLFRVTHDWWQPLGQFEPDLNVRDGAAVAHRLPDAAHNIMQVDHTQMRLGPTCLCQQLGNEATDPLNLGDNHLKKGPIFLGEMLSP